MPALESLPLRTKNPVSSNKGTLYLTRSHQEEIEIWQSRRPFQTLVHHLQYLKSALCPQTTNMHQPLPRHSTQAHAFEKKEPRNPLLKSGKTHQSQMQQARRGARKVQRPLRSFARVDTNSPLLKLQTSKRPWLRYSYLRQAGKDSTFLRPPKLSIIRKASAIPMQSQILDSLLLNTTASQSVSHMAREYHTRMHLHSCSSIRMP